MSRLIVDTCIWYALFDPTDDKHSYSDIIENILEYHNLIIPYPVLYETLNTRFVKNNYKQCDGLFSFINDPQKVSLVPDCRYREKALNIIKQGLNNHQHYSLVDIIIRLMMEDVDLGDKSVLSFNKNDFTGIKNVDVFSPTDFKK